MTTKEKPTPLDDAVDQAKTAENTDQASSAAAAAIQAVATREPPRGVPAALEHLRTLDEDASVLWITKGPKHSRTSEIGAIMAEIDGIRRVVIAAALDSGAFKLYAEVPGKGAGVQIANLSQLYQIGTID